MADTHDGADGPGTPGGIAVQDAEAIERLIEQLGKFSDDTAAAELRARYEAKLQQAREASKVRDPTVLLLRAQRNTKRRARQCLAARAAVRVLEAKITELLSEADEARRAVEAAEEAEAEAKLREESCRAQIAGFSPQLTPEAPGTATPVWNAEETVRGLRTQLEALPAAFRSGNLEAAHAAITAQLESLASSFAPVVPPQAPSTPIGARTAVPHGDTPLPATTRDTPPVSPRNLALALVPSPGARRRGSPLRAEEERTPARRSRSRGAGADDAAEGRTPGQASLDRWVVAARASSG